MFDTMTLTKTLGALCGSLLVYLMVSWGADEIYHVGPGEGSEEQVAAYVIDTGEEEAPAEDVAEVSFDEVYAAADPAAGEKLFNQCRACHKVDGSNGTGPHLNGVVERDAGSVEGYEYSAAMAAHEGSWTPEAISEFLANPKGYVEGTKMGYAGMKSVEDRADLVAWLATQG